MIELVAAALKAGPPDWLWVVAVLWTVLRRRRPGEGVGDV